jgi:hypothetical protein
MASPRPHRLRRRVLLGAPALVVAAVTVAARPGVAQAATPPECVADLIVADRLRGS